MMFPISKMMITPEPDISVFLPNVPSEVIPSEKSYEQKQFERVIDSYVGLMCDVRKAGPLAELQLQQHMIHAHFEPTVMYLVGTPVFDIEFMSWMGWDMTPVYQAGAQILGLPDELIRDHIVNIAKSENDIYDASEILLGYGRSQYKDDISDTLRYIELCQENTKLLPAALEMSFYNEVPFANSKDAHFSPLLAYLVSRYTKVSEENLHRSSDACRNLLALLVFGRAVELQDYVISLNNKLLVGENASSDVTLLLSPLWRKKTTDKLVSPHAFEEKLESVGSLQKSLVSLIYDGFPLSSHSR